MCQFDTKRWVQIATIGTALLGTALLGQTLAPSEVEFKLNWRPIGTTVVFNGRAGFSGAPAGGLWFSIDGQSLEVQLASGRIFRTEDFENWTLAAKAGVRAPGAALKVVDRLPETGAVSVGVAGNPYRAYALGKALWRSDDGGKRWVNLVAFGGLRLIGENVRAIAVSPVDDERLATVTDEGIWLSVDGGQSWTSLNQGLPNLYLRRLQSAPKAGRGLLAEWQDGQIVEWMPGAKSAWMGRKVNAGERGAAKWADAQRPGTRLEVREEDRSKIYRTLDGGLRWDDLTSDLPASRVLGLTADRASGAIYVATERGIYFTLNSLELPSGPTSWVKLGGNVPKEAALDVMLDEGANFLYASIAGDGVFLTYAPHRRRDPALISAANLESRTAAPGALMSVVGLKVSQAQISGRSIPILSATQDETQVQIPYDASLPSVAIEMNGEGGRSTRMELDVAETAPVIFTDRDGAPLVLDAESGELLDPAKALRPGMRIQILLTGLGRVDPAWPAGVAAPATNAPKVVAPVRVWMDGKTLEVAKAELAGGYVGFYAVETQLPLVVDASTVSLTVEAGGRLSNTILIRTIVE